VTSKNDRMGMKMTGLNSELDGRKRSWSRTENLLDTQEIEQMRIERGDLGGGSATTVQTAMNMTEVSICRVLRKRKFPGEGVAMKSCRGHKQRTCLVPV
jgi:hypothetical protein